MGENNELNFWIYDRRLFNVKEELKKPLKELRKIPEGIIFCTDPHKIYTKALYHTRSEKLNNFSIYGILKNLENKNLLSKGATHFIQVGAIEYHWGDSMWGIFSKDFNKLASFHEE